MATSTLDSAVATRPNPNAGRKIYVSRLLHGRHEGCDPETGKTRQYHAGVPGRNIVRDYIDLAGRWPEKFERVADEGGPAPDPETTMQPGETLNAFALRIAELARTRGASITSAPVQTPQAGVSTGVPPASADGNQGTFSITPSQYATFETMNSKDLIAHCEAEEIALKGATKKEDILKVLKGLVRS